MAARARKYQIVEGTSEPQDFTLLNNGTALNGTGFTLGLVLYQQGQAVSGMTAAWLDQSAGTVRVTGVESLTTGEYAVRFTLTDSLGKKGFVPGGPNVLEADRWIVVPVHA